MIAGSGARFVVLPEHCGRVKRIGLSVQVARGKVKSQEGRERREGIEVHVSTGYWLPGELEGWEIFQEQQVETSQE